MRAVLRRPDFRLLFAGVCISMLAESVLLLALAIWVKDLTGSNGMAGATILAVVAPSVLAPFVGWVVDRFRRRPFLVVTHLVSAVALMPLLAVRDRADVWIIYAVAFAYGLSYIAVGGALGGLRKTIVPEDLLAEANGALQTVRQGLRLVGPLLGAGLYTAIGGAALAGFAAVGLVAAAGVILAVRVREDRPRPTEQHWRAEVAAGVRHLVAHPALRRTVTGLVFAVLVLGMTEAVFFAYVDQGLHRPPAFVGVMVTVQGIGGLLGGLAAARVVGWLGEVGATAAGVLAVAVSCFGLTWPSLALGMPATVLCGAGLPILIVGFQTLLQRVTPGELMGRTSAAVDALISGPMALSIAAGAVLVSIVDYRVLFAVAGAGMIAAGAYLWVGRALSAPVVRDEGVRVEAAPVG